MANETKTVRIEIPTNPGSSIHITSSDRGQTIVTIEQSSETHNVIKIISSPSKSYNENQMEHGCDTPTVKKKIWSNEVQKRGFMYVSETHDGRKVDTSQLVKPNALPYGYQDVETNSSQKTNQQNFVSKCPIVKDDLTVVESSCEMKTSCWLDEETDEATHHGSSSSPKTRDTREVERSQIGETFSLLGGKDNVSEEKSCALKTENKNSLGSARPKTRHWSLFEADPTRRLTRRRLLSRVQPSPVSRKEMKFSARNEALRNNQKNVSKSALCRDETKFSTSPMSRVYFKKKSCNLSKIKTEPLFERTDTCSVSKQTKTAISNITNISGAKKISKIKETRSSLQEIKRRSDRFNNKSHESGKRKSLLEAQKKLSQLKSTPAITRNPDFTTDKQKRTDHRARQNKQSNAKFHINRRGKGKARRNLNYVLFKGRKVFVPNINIIKQLNLQCRVSLKPIRVVETTNQNLNYRSELVEKLYSKQNAKDEPRGGNAFDFYVQKLVTVLSSMKPTESFPPSSKGNSLKVVQKDLIVNGDDGDAFDVNALFDEIIQKSTLSEQVERKISEFGNNTDVKAPCFLDTSENTPPGVEKTQKPILRSQAGSNVISSVDVTLGKASAKTLLSDLKPCFVLIGEESRAENILRARTLRYLQCIPKHGDIPQDTSAQPALRPYLLPYAWELPLHIYEHLRKHKLIKGSSAVRRLVSQCKVTSSLHL